MKIIFDDGEVRKLPDVSYEVFMEHMFKEGSSDIEYSKYLRDNMMHELDSFSSESLLKSTLVFECNGRVIKFNCVYDSDPID